MDKLTDKCADIENCLLFRSHQPSGPVHKNICKRHALQCFKDKDDMKGIYSLTESHAPTYRIKTTYRYDKILASTENNKELTMDKNFVSFTCPVSFDNGIKCMLDKVKELPKEWTIVQITTKFNAKESMQLDMSKIYTDSLHICVFNCGQNNVSPFHISVPAPKNILGSPVELCQEMCSIIEENKTLLFSCFGSDLKNITLKQKKIYSERRSGLNSRLKCILQQIEKNWLREWRSLLIGKFVDEKALSEIFAKIDDILKSSSLQITDKMQYILHKIIAGSEHLQGNEILKALYYCFPDNLDLRTKIYKEIMNIANNFRFKNMKRYPVLLVLDEKLDCFPWEMIDVLNNHSVSRIPSLHFAYALYKEHETTIVNGYKEVKPNGSYIVNPGLDLQKMEIRLKEFFKYWLPQWNGIVGETPTTEKFINCLTNKDIFIYNGHGSGTQFLSANKIQQMRVNSVVFLFGCGSSRMIPMGNFVEMYDVFHNYLIACSPCVIGMLWEVTDFDTDILSTSLLSYWIPSNSKVHWKLIDKVKWEKGNIMPLNSTTQKSKSNIDFEPELLQAINIAQKEAIQFLTKCAIVARGLPVKMIS